MFWWRTKNQRLYLDYAAATPLHPAVRAAMEPYFSEVFGNPSSVHAEGVDARVAVENARQKLARTLGVQSRDVIFTAGGTEANNIAILGHIRALHAQNIPYTDTHVITTETEHPSVTEVCRELEALGTSVTWLPVDSDGRISIQELERALNPHTRLVSLALANSETGVVQHVSGCARALRRYNAEHGTAIRLHTDASQAPLWLSVMPESLGVELMTLDAAKCNGPKGGGVLVHRRGVPLAQTSFGGSQERGLRPGTENVAAVVGTAEALARAQASYESRAARVKCVRDRAIAALTAIEGVVLNGSIDHRLANNINISITGIDSEYAVVVLDAAGIAAATKSACSGADSSASSVVYAMTGDTERARSTIRFTLTPETTHRDMDRVVQVLARHCARMRPWKPVH